jgi:integrase
MRQRHSTGGVRKQRGRWLGLWYEDGIKKSRVLGLVRDMTKGEAREAVAKIVRDLRTKHQLDRIVYFGGFVEGTFFPFYSRKWKHSTRDKTINRIDVHLVRAFRDRELSSFKRDELQDFLDRKAATLSYSTTNHLRWDAKQIFDMAVAEGLIKFNPALLLFTPKEAKRPTRRTMTLREVRIAISSLGQRERLILKLAILAGMRPGEIFALRWGRVGETFAAVVERVYEGVLDTPKSEQSVREAALAAGLMLDLEKYREVLGHPADQTFVFPSERGTPLAKNNVWNRNIKPKLKAVGLEWCTFQVMRRTHSNLMKALKADPKLVADQLGHTLDVNQNIYTQSPVELRLPLVNELENLIASD